MAGDVSRANDLPLGPIQVVGRRRWWHRSIRCTAAVNAIQELPRNFRAGFWIGLLGISAVASAIGWSVGLSPYGALIAVASLAGLMLLQDALRQYARYLRDLRRLNHRRSSRHS
jgi:hypothetical protein